MECIEFKVVFRFAQGNLGAETGGGGAVEVELALGDAGEVDVLEAVELVADLEGEVRRAVNDVEGLGSVREYK